MGTLAKIMKIMIFDEKSSKIMIFDDGIIKNHGFDVSEKVRTCGPRGTHVGAISDPKMTTIEQKKGIQKSLQKGLPLTSQTRS